MNTYQIKTTDPAGYYLGLGCPNAKDYIRNIVHDPEFKLSVQLQEDNKTVHSVIIEHPSIKSKEVLNDNGALDNLKREINKVRPLGQIIELNMNIPTSYSHSDDEDGFNYSLNTTKDTPEAVEDLLVMAQEVLAEAMVDDTYSKMDKPTLDAIIQNVDKFTSVKLTESYLEEPDEDEPKRRIRSVHDLPTPPTESVTIKMWVSPDYPISPDTFEEFQSLLSDAVCDHIKGAELTHSTITINKMFDDFMRQTQVFCEDVSCCHIGIERSQIPIVLQQLHEKHNPPFSLDAASERLMSHLVSNEAPAPFTDIYNEALSLSAEARVNLSVASQYPGYFQETATPSIAHGNEVDHSAKLKR